ncbi:MAG: ATP-binding protein [Myxococcota bacterium]
MWGRRVIPWLLSPVGLTLAAASWSATRLVGEVNQVRSELGQRVRWLIDIQTVLESASSEPPDITELEDATTRLLATREAFETAIADGEETQEAVSTLMLGLDERPLPAIIEPASHTLVRALRAQTASISSQLDGYWDHLGQLVAWSVTLSVAIMGLCVWILVSRAREERLSEKLRRLTAQQLAARSQANLEQIMATMPVGVAIQAEGVMVYANSRLAHLLHAGSPDALVGRPLQVDASIDVSEPVDIRWDGAPATLVVVRDLSEWNALQAQLRLADRMASVGTMASGVAHEINNPLTYVVLHLDELTRIVSGNPEAGNLLQPVRQGIDRVRQVVRDLSTLARSSTETEATTHDLMGLLHSTARMATYPQRHSVEIDVRGSPVPPVNGNEARLGQVFLNLMVNAVQAISAHAPEGRGRVEVRVSKASDDVVLVEVSDNGPGISSADLEHLFDPFFTTKPVGEGTGLGLFICHRIVKETGGRIEVVSPPGRGATFRVELPVADREAAVADRPPSYSLPPERNLVVLVLDDEPLVGRALARLLYQHEVVVAQSVREARDAIANRPVDVVLCDLHLPDEPGRNFYAHLETTDPELASRVLFMTGGPLTRADEALLEETNQPTLEKPVEPGLLEAAIEQMARSSFEGEQRP